MKFWDRLHQQEFTTLSEQQKQNFLLGQWQIFSARAKLNGIDWESHFKTYLVPDATKQWTLRTGAYTFIGKIPAWQITADESLCFFAKRYQEMLAEESSWQDWANTSPLVPEIDKEIQIQLLERSIKDTIPHLEEVCHRPRTYLKMETERLPVSRAQRISPHAIEYLSCHTEDWERKTFKGVYPKNVLSLVREDLLDIYENRVAVRLIDSLLAYLNKRINKIEKLKDEIEQIYNFSKETEKIHWRNRKRICCLWGESYNAAPQLKEAEATLSFLQHIKLKLLSLVDTDLYKVIPHSAKIDNTLKNTNILINDHHYREIAKLWRKWSQWQSKQSRTAKQLFDFYQDTLNGFDVFCCLLCSRALTVADSDHDTHFGFALDSEHLPQKGHSYCLQSETESIQFQWSLDGCIHLNTDNLSSLNFIPLAAQLAESPDEGTTKQVLELLTETSRGSQNSHTIILYFGRNQDLSKLPLSLQTYFNTIGNDLPTDEHRFSLIPVSPLDILSTERVARAIQWWLRSQQYKRYPIKQSRILPQQIINRKNWVRQDKEQCLVILPPSDSDRAAFVSELRSLIKAEESRGPSSKGEVKKLQSLETFPEEVSKQFIALLTCPTCKEKQPPSSFKSDNGCFQVLCNQCATSWGLQTCRKCQQNYPYIKVNWTNPELSNSSVGWIDGVFGRDVLAVPCPHDSQLRTYICPSCGVCANAQKSTSYSCKRCDPISIR